MITRTTAQNRIPVALPSTAEVEIPLTTSINPKFGFGLPTYSRASIATFTDCDGILRTAKSGEPRFEGSRRVENGVTYSELLTDASWSKTNVAITLDTQTINRIPVFKVTNDATNALHSFNKTTGTSVLAGNKCIVSCIAKAGTSNFIQLFVGTSFSTEYVNIDLSSGTAVQGNTSQAQITSLGSGFYRISLLINCLVSGSINVYCNIITSGTTGRNVGYIGAGEYIYATAFQMENVTGQTIQTVGEYVSTNVLSFPYHGAGVDGVKYFDTTLTGTKLTPKGYYAEGSRTNLFLQSNSFTTTWTKNAAQLVITANSGTCPDGSNSMWKLSPGAGSALQSVVQSVTVAASQYAFSVYAKAGENTVLQLFTSGAISNGYVNFDLSDGTIGASSLWTGSIESVGNGIYRCIAITDTLVATTNSIHLSQVPTRTTGRAGNISGDGVSGLYVYGAQFELGTFPSTYIPTTTGTVNRVADALSYNVANAQSNYGAAFIDINLRYLPTTGVDRRAFGITGNTNNRMQIVGTTLGSKQPHLSMGNGSAVLVVNVGALSANTQVKLAAKWVNGGAGNLFQGGVKSSDLASPQAVATQFDIGNVGGVPLYGTMRNVKVWKTPPTDTELIAITSN